MNLLFLTEINIILTFNTVLFSYFRGIFLKHYVVLYETPFRRGFGDA